MSSKPFDLLPLIIQLSKPWMNLGFPSTEIHNIELFHVEIAPVWDVKQKEAENRLKTT